MDPSVVNYMVIVENFIIILMDTLSSCINSESQYLSRYLTWHLRGLCQYLVFSRCVIDLLIQLESFSSARFETR